MGRESCLAWVESPLQMLGAAEWAAERRIRLPFAVRMKAGMIATADELVARGARLGDMSPAYGIPWNLLAHHRHWLVGDGFSGQFRLAAAVLRPRRITFLDDGAHALPFADSILGARPYARPDVAERGLARRVAPVTRDVILRRARDERAEFYTAFEFGERRDAGLLALGFDVRRHAFDWTRRSARGTDDLGPRIVLGSARPVDKRMALADFLAWVRAVAASGAVSYLPHRREPERQLAAVAAIPGVRVVRSEVAVELVLAGATGPLDVFTLPSSTTTTLPLVLSGADVRLHTLPADRVRAGR